MTVSRRMETDEFNRLMGEENSTVVLAYTLKPMAFNPPTLDDATPADPFEDDDFTVLLLNVLEPAFYKFPANGEVVLILPKTQIDDFDYNFMADVHPKGDDAWGYRFAPRGWDAGNSAHDLEDVSWFLKYDQNEVPPFEDKRTETH